MMFRFLHLAPGAAIPANTLGTAADPQLAVRRHRQPQQRGEYDGCPWSIAVMCALPPDGSTLAASELSLPVITAMAVLVLATGVPGLS